MAEKAMNFEFCDQVVRTFEDVVKHPVKGGAAEYYTGVDLGTACVVVAVMNEKGEPVAGKYQYADIVRDGMIVDYIGYTGPPGSPGCTADPYRPHREHRHPQGSAFQFSPGHRRSKLHSGRPSH